jgi:hypothetical protein
LGVAEIVSRDGANALSVGSGLIRSFSFNLNLLGLLLPVHEALSVDVRIVHNDAYKFKSGWRERESGRASRLIAANRNPLISFVETPKRRDDFL